jgi:hypothetical protein
MLFFPFDVLRLLRQEVRRDLLLEVKKHKAKKAIGPESPIGPCIATPGVDNRPACCFRKRWRRHKQRNGTTGENNRISVSHAETKQNPLPGEDHSQSSKGLRSNSWAECRDKKEPASSRGGKICLDIPFNRTDFL